MILTTTQNIEGRVIAEYKGIVFGEVITGVNLLNDFGAGINSQTDYILHRSQFHKKSAMNDFADKKSVILQHQSLKMTD